MNGSHASQEPPEAHVIDSTDIDDGMLDQDALRVISRLVRSDHEAYLVGGCVRDLLVGRIPKDYDVATDAHPRQIKRLFRNGRIIGRRFRLVHIYYGRNIVETATFRCEPRQDPSGNGDLLITEDNEYGTAGEDARRRDFTVNGLFLDPLQGKIIDYVGGLEDLEEGLLRTIGDPMVRIAEDPVRILRAIKFATRLGFRIEEKTWEAICALTPDLSRSAPPRVLEEILRLMRSGTALGAFRMMRACGALKTILPRVDQFLGGDEDDKAGGDGGESAEQYWRLLEALDADVHAGAGPSTAVCIALLFYPIIEHEVQHRRKHGSSRADMASVGGEILEEIAEATRLSRRDASRARRIISQQQRFTQPASKRFRPLLFMRGEDFPDALELFRLRSAARGQGWDIYEGWLTRYKRALDAPHEEVETERKRSRRRRPRRK